MSKLIYNKFFSDNYDVVAVIIHDLGNRTNSEEQVWHSVYIFTEM